MDKQKELDKIAKQIEACDECKVGKHGRAVPGEGNPDADILFVGEAPGRNEAETGRPFIGRSGKFLRSQIAEVGLRDEDVYITSPVKYLPDYVTPTDSDISHGMTHMSRQIEVINPKIIVLLGSVAVRGILGEKRPVAKEHGTIIELNGKKYFISYHPSAAIRFTKIRALFTEDFKKLKNLL